jgi:hypothetical protein
MPIGYSDDVRLRELTKAAKAKLDILTGKLGQVKKEFELAEREYGDLVAQMRRVGYDLEDKAPPIPQPPPLGMNPKKSALKPKGEED